MAGNLDINLAFGENSLTSAFILNDGNLAIDQLTCNEKALTLNFSKDRYQEFIKGRFCAKQALNAAGCLNPEILTGPNGEPVWPAGFAGSISHSKKITGAVVSRLEDIETIGLDIESIKPVKKSIWRLLYSQKEQIYLRSLKPYEQAFNATLYFSIKESFYKMQYPITYTKLWFTDLQVTQLDGAIYVSIVDSCSLKSQLPEPTKIIYRQWEEEIISCCFMKR